MKKSGILDKLKMLLKK